MVATTSIRRLCAAPWWRGPRPRTRLELLLSVGPTGGTELPKGSDIARLLRTAHAAAAGPTLTAGLRRIDRTDTSIKTSSSRRPPIHRGACGGVAEVECRVYEEPLEGDGTGSCRCFQLTEHAHATQSHHINELWFALCALPEQLDCSGKQMLPQRGHI